MATVNDNALVSASEVGEIVDTDLTESQMNNFINMAYYATLPLSGELGDCGGEDTLKEIQKNLAAHFSKTIEPEVVSEKIGPTQAKFGGKLGELLMSTRYGQAALLLDCSGTLATSGKKGITFEVMAHSDFD